MSKHTIVYLINNLKMGGAESIVRDLSFFFIKKNGVLLL
jgi:hypothetical protein